MKIFVTGGSGYVGRNFIQEAIKEGHSIVALARSEKSAEKIKQMGATPVVGDVMNPETLQKGMEGCEFLVHAAADGNPLKGVDETQPIPKKHSGSYSSTKARAEEAALEENKNGLSVVVVRPRFVWGKYLTSTCHVINLANGILDALKMGKGGEIYFFTDSPPVKFKEFITSLLSSKNIKVNVETVPRWLVKFTISAGYILEPVTFGIIKPAMSRQEYGTVAHEMTVSDAKARREIGYKNRISMEEGLKELKEVKLV